MLREQTWKPSASVGLNRCTDMAFDTQLDASGEVGRAEVADMVAVCIGWSQPMY